MRPILAWLWIAALGCTGTETGNPSVRAKTAAIGWSSDLAAVSTEPGSAVVLEGAWLAIGELRFAPHGSCEGMLAHTGGAPVVLDLLAEFPETIDQDVEIGPYCGLAVTLVEDAGATLRIAARAADGTRVDRSVVGPLDVDLTVADGAFLIDETHHDHLLALDLARFYAADDLAMSFSLHADRDADARLDPDDHLLASPH